MSNHQNITSEYRVRFTDPTGETFTLGTFWSASAAWTFADAYGAAAWVEGR